MIDFNIPRNHIGCYAV